MKYAVTAVIGKHFDAAFLSRFTSLIIPHRAKLSNSPRIAGLTLFLCLLCWFIPVRAVQDVYPFDNTQDKTQFSRLTQEVRCLVCQNQSIADSNAPFAADLRAEVYRLIGLHNSDAEIKAHLTQRYGAYVLLQPPLASQTWVLWVAPLGLLLLGFGVLYRIITRQSRASSAEST